MWLAENRDQKYMMGWAGAQVVMCLCYKASKVHMKFLSKAAHFAVPDLGIQA